MAKKKSAQGNARRKPGSSRGQAATASFARGLAASDASLDFSVVYIHGIGSQGPPEEAKRDWDTALFGQAMGDTDMAYWADIRHPVASGVRTRTLGTPDKALAGADARRFMQALQSALGVADGVGRGQVRHKVFSLLPGVGDALFRWLSGAFIRDTAAYFFDAAQRRAMQDRLIAVLEKGAHRPIVLVAHSQGTIISYDVLRRLGGRTPSGKALDVALLVTLGSPLGIDEVQRKLTEPLEVPRGVAAWMNFADLLDPVAMDKGLKGEFEGAVQIRDTTVRNPVLLNPHAAAGYLSTAQVRQAVYSVLGWNQLRYGSRVRKDVLADLVRAIGARELEAEGAQAERHPVLIELRDAAGFGADARRGLIEKAEVRSLKDHQRDVVDFLERSVASKEEARIDPLQRFVAARLTSSEVQRVETECQTSVYCVWKNSRKRALIGRSADVVQVPAARAAYRADGSRVRWAVLDTGVNSDHPHFLLHETIASVLDCTRPGPPASLLGARRGSSDPDGHGTHVCGIIAGEQKDGVHRGLAPRAKLHVYKVLDDQGFGEDGWIIKAIQHIADTNNAAADLVIHGVNLSLGGPFDPEVYGCGHSPICQELRRLWRQGLLVCVACGNEGAVDVSTPEGTETINRFLSIGDPANLDECIAVGSVHADRPHSYGISYFSSKGPTADGRSKPDVVAPGERISSCNSRFAPKDPTSHYLSLSGTSMATPHVSGLAAAFLSVRREFVGRPDEVKRLLIANCTDLARDKYLQGAGMPNLVKMLANT